MRLGKYLLVAFSAVSMTSSPVLAQAAPARAAAEVANAEGLGGNGILSDGGFIIPLIAAIAVALGFLVSTGNDAPVSP